jgi:disease resistance protein RPM1
MFPEDLIIGRDELIWRWVAENFVHGREDDNLYEAGDKYFNDLINRSLIQPTQVDSFGKAQACRVHDMVLEYVTWLSAEENFVTILSDQHFPSEPDNIHRLSLRYRKVEHCIPHTIKRLPHVRTLGVSASHAIDLMVLMPPLSIFPVLRVLDLEQCTSYNIKGLGNLVHLRYLRLSSQAYYGYDWINLPEGIGNLRLLQILDLKEARIEELPSTVVQLKQLRVLVLSVYRWDKKYEKHLLQCLCSLKKLEALDIFARGSSLDFMLKVDCALSQLRRFAACSREPAEHILRLGSIWRELSSFSTLPRWINSSLSRLSDLSITVKILQQGDVEMLATVPMLRTLGLEVIEATEGRLEITKSNGHATTFRCLSDLRFVSRAVGLVFRPGGMQKLHRLYLCFDLAQTKYVYSNFDLGLENLTSLEIVEVEMDCRGATLWEAEAAEGALRNSANANPNCPTAYLRRHFEREMIYDQEEYISDELVSRKKQDVLIYP